MSVTLSGNTSSPVTSNAYGSSSSQQLASKALDVAQSATQLAQAVIQQNPGTVKAPPKDSFQAAPGEPANTFQAAYESMSPGKAAETLLKNFHAIEGVGMNDSGKGAGDSNIGRRELERTADPQSGFPPEARAAAKWLLDHPISARSIDQGASQARGNANEYHFSRDDLQALASSMPASTPAASSTPTASTPTASTPAAVPGTSGSNPGPAGAPQRSTFEAPTPAPVNLSGSGTVSAMPMPAMDIYSAANVLKSHFKFAEGVGMNDSGKGAGDNNIGLSELTRLAQPNSGAPAEVREAARFLLEHPTAMRSLDQGASKNKPNLFGNPREVHIGLKDLEAFTANAPASRTVSGSLGAAQLARQMTIYG